MKRTGQLLAILAATLLGACGGESDLPSPTGKASITAINAIYGSPPLEFLIEERALGAVPYKGSSSAVSYDDLIYNFSFDVFFAGDTEVTRIATQNLDMVAGQHYTLLASGTLAATTITVWETAERDFDAAATVFQVRFAHTSDSLGMLDVYYALDGVVPVLGEEVATLSFSEITTPMDFETDSYVTTVTTSGDPTDVVFQSVPAPILARTDLIITPFDGDANDTSPIILRGLIISGSAIGFLDPLFPSTLEFLHAANDMGVTDVYDDEELMSRILTAHDFKDLTLATDIVAGDYRYLYTPTGDPPGDASMVLLDTAFSPLNGVHYRIMATGSGGIYATANIPLNRRSVSTSVKLNLFSASNNVEFLNLYVVEPDASIEDTFPFRPGIISRQPLTHSTMVAGSFDLYLTESLETDIIAGPFRIDTVLGDVLDLIIYDTVDPAVLEFELLPVPGMVAAP